MPLLSYDPMADGDGASANLWNVRLSKIHDLLNGNLDAANLADGAVTTPKIADGAVTSAKIAVNKYIDNNGWSVEDYGSTKNYNYTKSGTVSLNHQSWTTLFTIPLPVGKTNVNQLFVTLSSTIPLAEAIFNFYPGANNTLSVSVSNSHPSYDLVSGAYTVQIMAKDV